MTPPRPQPKPTADTLPFWQAANEDRLVVQTCRNCGNTQFYPRGFCVSCLSDDLDWVQSAGRGAIYSFTVCRVPGHPSMADQVPYAMALVDLDDGIRMLAQIVETDLDQVTIGAPVQVVFQRLSDDIQLPQFKISSEVNA